MVIEEKRNIGEEVNSQINDAYRLGYQRGLEQGRREKNPKFSQEEVGKTMTQFDIAANNLSAVVEELKTVIRSYRPGTIERDTHSAIYKCVRYLEEQIKELDKRTR